MTAPKVSVIMPSLNVASYIRECMDSALNQTLREIEIICVDAGSIDGTWEILQEYAARDARIRLLHSDKKSYGYQMNLGFDHARGEYLAILETDDYIKPEMLEVLYRTACQYSLDFVKSDYEIFVGDKDHREFTYMRTCPKRKYYRQVLNPRNRIDIFNARMNTWTGLYSRAFLEKHNIRHNETAGASYQDNGFWFQTFLWASRIMFLDRAFYQLRRDNPNSSVHSKDKAECIFEEYQFIENIIRADPELERLFIQIFHKKKFDNYQFHYSRIDNSLKLDFVYRMRDEFKAARTAGELNPSLFYRIGYEELCAVMDEPERFYIRSAQCPVFQSDSEKAAYLEIQARAYQQEINALKKSASFRLGKALTLLPRKLVGGIHCLKENGLEYTIDRIKYKIRGLLGTGCE